MMQRIVGRSRQISTFPMAGRLVPEFQVRQIREVFENPYRIIYRIRADRIDVIAVVHMSRHLDTIEQQQNN
jgi:plasmid stabilization system protein ParE